MSNLNSYNAALELAHEILTAGVVNHMRTGDSVNYYLTMGALWHTHVITADSYDGDYPKGLQNTLEQIEIVWAKLTLKAGE